MYYSGDTFFLLALQVSAALDALVDIADGRIDIHVLMALAAFASIFMGNSLEGGLLLAMFSLAYIGTYVEKYLNSSHSSSCLCAH